LDEEKFKNFYSLSNKNKRQDIVLEDGFVKMSSQAGTHVSGRGIL
jgi:hypothetical protein